MGRWTTHGLAEGHTSQNVEGQREGQKTDQQTHRQIIRWIGRMTDGVEAPQTDGRTDGWTHRWTYRRTYRRTDRQTDRLTNSTMLQASSIISRYSVDVMNTSEMPYWKLWRSYEANCVLHEWARDQSTGTFKHTHTHTHTQPPHTHTHTLNPLTHTHNTRERERELDSVNLNATFLYFTCRYAVIYCTWSNDRVFKQIFLAQRFETRNKWSLAVYNVYIVASVQLIICLWNIMF